MTAATGAPIPAWATTANRKHIHNCLLKLDVMARNHPNRDAVFREMAAVMGLPAGLPRWQMIDCVQAAIRYINRTTPQLSRLALCHHEAGHAIVADALGIRVRQVSMRAPSNTGGSCLLLPANRQPGLSTPGGALRWCTALAAGPVATRVYHARVRTPLDEESFIVQKRSDAAEMMRIILAASRRDDWLEAAYMTAGRLVVTHWPAIVRLARRLYQDHRDVSGGELISFLRYPARRHVPLRYGRAWPHDVLMRREGDAGR